MQFIIPGPVKTPHKNGVNAEGNGYQEEDDRVESQKASEAWRGNTPK